MISTIHSLSKSKREHFPFPRRMNLVHINLICWCKQPSQFSPPHSFPGWALHFGSTCQNGSRGGLRQKGSICLKGQFRSNKTKHFYILPWFWFTIDLDSIVYFETLVQFNVSSTIDSCSLTPSFLHNHLTKGTFSERPGVRMDWSGFTFACGSLGCG